MNAVASSTIHRFLLAVLMLAGFVLAPSVFARDHHGGGHHGGGHHNSFGISIGGPGYGVSYSGCRHCGSGWWNGYVNTGWGYPRYGGHHGYYGGYAGGYYPAPYYGGYYPSYSTVVVERPIVRRVVEVRHVSRYNDDDDYDNDDRRSHRDRYYDDDRDYEHLDRDYRD